MWQSAGQRTADGYDVEIRIPFSTCAFLPVAAISIGASRCFAAWPRDKRPSTGQLIPRDSKCFQCEWGQYEGMAGVHQGRNLEVVPTLTVGKTQTGIPPVRAGTVANIKYRARAGCELGTVAGNDLERHPQSGFFTG